MVSWSAVNDDLEHHGDLGFWSTASGDLKCRDGEFKHHDGELKCHNCELKRREGELKRRNGELKHCDDDLGFLHFKNRLREYVRERENKVGKVRKKNGAECF